MTQPTLSAAIRELETALDIMIVERDQRFRGLTAEGDRVLDWARRILADCQSLRQEVDARKLGLSGRLRLGVIPTALAGLGLLTAPFRAQHSRVQATILSMSSQEIQRSLEVYDIDAGITYLDNEPFPSNCGFRMELTDRA